MEGNLPASKISLPPSIDGELVRSNRLASRADETKRALRRNWSDFQLWCEGQGFPSMPASLDVVEVYLLYLSDQHSVRGRDGKILRTGLKSSAVCQALWAINTAHRLAGRVSPGDSEQIKTALSGIKRRKGMRKKQQAPLTIEHLQGVRWKTGLKGYRDKALLLIGFAACLRRSEIVALNAEDIEETRYGLRLYLKFSKTDQEGVGAWVDVVRATKLTNACPVKALSEWLQAAEITDGPIFRSLTKGTAPTLGGRLSPVTVDALVKWAAKDLGLEPGAYGGHSLRAGKATYLSEKGKSPVTIAKHGRWKSLDMVLTYCRGETARELDGVY